MHAVLATVILQLAKTDVPATLVHLTAPVAETLELTPNVAVPELPDDQIRLTVCVGLEACRVKLDGLLVTVVTPVTLTLPVAMTELMMLADGHGAVADEHASTATGSAHSVAAPSCLIS